MTFADPHVSVTQLSDRLWTVDAPLSFDYRGTTVRVPIGYITDFASVPRPIWWLIPPYGAYTAATIIHDWLITDMLPTRQIDSRGVDSAFREAMHSLGVGFARRWLMWTGVRWAALTNPRRRGGWAWLRDLPVVLLVSLLALPLLLPAVAVVPSLLIAKLIDRLTTR